eukprot:12156138-Alexandrium_andersonii.AAC.1
MGLAHTEWHKSIAALWSDCRPVVVQLPSCNCRSATKRHPLCRCNCVFEWARGNQTTAQVLR